MGSTPSSSAASVMPSKPSWLKDLSSNPPASETMQGTKSEASPPLPSSVSSGADAQPASSTAAPNMARPPMAAFLIVTFTVSSKDCAPTVAGLVESRYRMLRRALRPQPPVTCNGYEDATFCSYEQPVRPLLGGRARLKERSG